ncbi:MAG: ParB/RepB/Spo0J family partition protein [Actinomycetota bacterium]|nr:ParB/RepB/Spo0J family partition protein [Actinomycetota bacterium]
MLPGSDAPDIEGRGGLVELAVDLIDPNPRQPRAAFDDASLEELAASMRELGILQPVLVRAVDGRYELIAGERRVRAARHAGLDAVPALIVETDERGSLERALVENVHREDLNPIEEAAAYKQLLEEGGVTQEALGERLGKTRGAIANTLRLLELPTAVQRMLIEGRLTAGHGRALLGLASPALQERLAQRVAAEGLTVRQTEEVVRRYGGYSTATTPGAMERRERPALVAEAQRALADRLQTRVRVEMGKRKGKIVVDFVSLDELQRLLAAIVGPPKGTS